MDGIGSSVIIALAAVMWFLYFIPTWLKRKEYLATERNAVRLQQTMRILAESAEVPSVVRVEATARTVAAQQRALRQQQRQAQARAFARPAASVSDQVQRTVDSGVRTRHRLRRSRALATLALAAALLGIGFGIPAATVGNWLILAASVAVGIGSMALLGQAATVARARRELRRVSMASAMASELHDYADYAPARRAAWTPVPVPRPLYLTDPAPAARSARSHVSGQAEGERRLERSDVSAELDHAVALRAASEQAQRALRAAQESPEVARLRQPTAPAVAPAAAAPSRFASMGVLDPTASNTTDLDEILRRRRAAG